MCGVCEAGMNRTRVCSAACLCFWLDLPRVPRPLPCCTAPSKEHRTQARAETGDPG